jgi:hypothetical protein
MIEIREGAKLAFETQHAPLVDAVELLERQLLAGITIPREDTVPAPPLPSARKSHTARGRTANWSKAEADALRSDSLGTAGAGWRTPIVTLSRAVSDPCAWSRVMSDTPAAAGCRTAHSRDALVAELCGQKGHEGRCEGVRKMHIGVVEAGACAVLCHALASGAPCSHL